MAADALLSSGAADAGTAVFIQLVPIISALTSTAAALEQGDAAAGGVEEGTGGSAGSGRAPFRSFFEDEHLAGGTDMVALLAAVHTEERRRRAEGRPDWSIPMRPDHGQDILDDQGRRTQPGYPAIGRLKGLAELRGIWTALEHPDFGRG